MPISRPLFFFLNLENLQHIQLHMIQPLEVAQNENKNIFFKYSFSNCSFPLPWLHSLKPTSFIQRFAFCSL